MRHPYRDVVKPGVRFVQTTVRSIDPVAKHVETDDGPFDADILVVALGADLHPEATPGLVEGGSEFYTVDGAFALTVFNRLGRAHRAFLIDALPTAQSQYYAVAADAMRMGT